jgi:hypothetical protein
MPPLVPGGVLTLDLSSWVGFCYGHISDRVPWFGSWKLATVGGEGARYASFENELAATLEACAPCALILEAPLPLPAMNNVAAARQQLSLRACSYVEGYRASVPVSEIDVFTVRAEVLGSSGRGHGKPTREIVTYCHRRGWMVTDHHSGDACLIWQWHRQRASGRPGPLWGEDYAA